MRHTHKKSWAVCFEGVPMWTAKRKGAALASMAGYIKATGSGDGWTVEPVRPVVYGDFVLMERIA